MVFEQRFDASMEPFSANLDKGTTRGPESWQFFAFVFASLLGFGLSLLDEWTMPAACKGISKSGLFLLLGALFSSFRFRNKILMPLLGFWKRG